MALATLDKMLARSCNQAALQKALEKDFRADPVKFFRTMIMPLMPREAKVSMDQEGIVQWTSLLGVSARQVEGGAVERQPPALPCGDGGQAAESHGTEGTV